MADRLGAGLPNQLDGLDSRTPLHKFAVFVQWPGRQTASLHTPVRVWYTAPSLFADVVQEEERSFRKREVGISSIPVGPIVVPGKDRWRSAALVRLTGEFKSPAGTHCRKALRTSGRLITGREMVRFPGPLPGFFMGPGTAWGGRFPCKEDSQQGSIPWGSTKFAWIAEMD